MKTFFALTKRNIKLFFKDKGMLLASMITPIILLVLYATFLSNVYRDSFTAGLPSNFTVDEKLINGLVAGQLVSSLLAVTPVTVAFNCNMRSVSDKTDGIVQDLLVSPVKKSVIALSYFFGTLVTTLLVCYAACAFGLIYVAATGWYMSFGDVMLLILDVFILSAFGTVLSSLINMFLSTQGQMTAVGTIISAGYGFICGAYMPISQFGSGLQKAVAFLPGTYGTALLRNHALNGVLSELKSAGFPDVAVEGMRDSVDCNLYFFDTKVEVWAMYLVMTISIAVLLGVYLLVSALRKRSKK